MEGNPARPLTQRFGRSYHIKTWVYIAERHRPPEEMTATEFFETNEGYRVQSNGLKEILDPTVRGPTCAAPTGSQNDVQWEKIKWELAKVPMRLPSVFSNTKFVWRRLTPKVLGSLLDLPMKIIKGGDDASLQRWIDGSPIPFKTRAEVLRRIKAWSDGGYRHSDTPRPLQS
ncbi:hypothetical protein ACA910_017562 [Epithemia clementina (nom. ined.)]